MRLAVLGSSALFGIDEEGDAGRRVPHAPRPFHIAVAAPFHEQRTGRWRQPDQPLFRSSEGERRAVRPGVPRPAPAVPPTLREARFASMSQNASRAPCAPRPAAARRLQWCVAVEPGREDATFHRIDGAATTLSMLSPDRPKRQAFARPARVAVGDVGDDAVGRGS